MVVMETMYYACVPRSQCVLSSTNLSEEVFEENCLRLFVVVYKHVDKHVVVMEMMLHACVPSFMSMRCTVGKLEE